MRGRTKGSAGSPGQGPKTSSHVCRFPRVTESWHDTRADERVDRCDSRDQAVKSRRSIALCSVARACVIVVISAEELEKASSARGELPTLEIVPKFSKDPKKAGGGIHKLEVIPEWRALVAHVGMVIAVQLGVSTLSIQAHTFSVLQMTQSPCHFLTTWHPPAWCGPAPGFALPSTFLERTMLLQLCSETL